VEVRNYVFPTCYILVSIVKGSREAGGEKFGDCRGL